MKRGYEISNKAYMSFTEDEQKSLNEVREAVPFEFSSFSHLVHNVFKKGLVKLEEEGFLNSTKN
ncbi:MAG: hypothetical protein MRY49_03290 [Candidatus Pacebacteria bacterium]|nr:hypothetical protein [Candidatus Paceibacterota bacterium]